MHCGEELPTEREFGNFIDRYAVSANKLIPVVIYICSRRI